MRLFISDLFKNKPLWMPAFVLVLLAGCSGKVANIGEPKATVADAEKFVTEAEKRYLTLTLNEGRADWVQNNFITDDTEAIAAQAKDEAIKTIKELAEDSRKFDGLNLPPDVARKIKLLKLALTLPAPSDPATRPESACGFRSQSLPHERNRCHETGEHNRERRRNQHAPIDAKLRRPRQRARVQRRESRQGRRRHEDT